MQLLKPHYIFYTGRHQLLSLLKPVEMNEYSRKNCLPTTRLDIIKSIIEWITDESRERKSVLWLYGLAGSGKSTLSTTIAWMMRDLYQLGAFFFFDRDIPERNPATLIRTLAYQLALFDARIGDVISKIVENTPRIAEMPLDFQITNLLLIKAMELVEWSGGPIVLVVDALDEPASNSHRKELLKALSKGFHDLPSFLRVVVVSRQESDIQHALGSHPAVHRYPLDIDSPINQDDIRRFIWHQLDQIRRENEHLACDWPGEDKITTLMRSAGGLFVWASTACLYIDGYDPNRRLMELITHQSEINSSEPFAQLDKLYKTGLESARYWNDLLFCSDFRDILGVILCARNPLSPSVIDSLLELPQNRTCCQTISHLGCVLHIGESDGIRILHPSFHDYLSSRCSLEPWFVDLQLHNRKLALCCIGLLNRTLQKNICGLTLQVPDSVKEKQLSSAVSYACRFWIEHVCFILDDMNDILDHIYQFLCQHLLHWMEVLAILKCHELTIRTLKNLLGWIQVSCNILTSSSLKLMGFE